MISTLRHCLLRQPHGFKGVLGVEVRPQAERLPVLELSHEPDGRLDVGPGCPATSAVAADRYDSVSQIADLRDLDLDVAVW